MTVESDMKERLLPFYKNAPNILTLIEILADPTQDTTDACNYVLAVTNIDNKEGDQLDKAGERIGVKRPPLQETNVFTLCGIDDEPDYDNRTGFYNSTDGTGGYLTSEEGLRNVADPTLMMGDDDYRILIMTKAASFRKKANDTNLFNYLLAFLARCEILEAD